MQEMPVTLRFGKSKALQHSSFRFQVPNHIIHSDIIISDGGGFSIPRDAQVFQLHDQGRLVRLCSF